MPYYVDRVRHDSTTARVVRNTRGKRLDTLPLADLELVAGKDSVKVLVAQWCLSLGIVPRVLTNDKAYRGAIVDLYRSIAPHKSKKLDRRQTKSIQSMTLKRSRVYYDNFHQTQIREQSNRYVNDDLHFKRDGVDWDWVRDTVNFHLFASLAGQVGASRKLFLNVDDCVTAYKLYTNARDSHITITWKRQPIPFYSWRNIDNGSRYNLIYIGNPERSRARVWWRGETLRLPMAYEHAATSNRVKSGIGLNARSINSLHASALRAYWRSITFAPLHAVNGVNLVASCHKGTETTYTQPAYHRP